MSECVRSIRRAKNRRFDMPRRPRRPIPDGRVCCGSPSLARPYAGVLEPNRRDSISASARRGSLDRDVDARNILEPARPCCTSEARCRDGREERDGGESTETLAHEDICGPPSPALCPWRLFSACFGNGRAGTCCQSRFSIATVQRFSAAPGRAMSRVFEA